MKFQDLAQEYVAVNVFNAETRLMVLSTAKLFVERANITECEQITVDAVIRFKSTTLKTAKGVTYNGYLRYLRLLVDYGVNNCWMEANPFRKIKLAPTQSLIPKTLEDEVLLAVSTHLQLNPDSYKPVWFWQHVIYFLYFTGIRRKQLAYIKRGDLDLTRNILKLSYQGSKTHREWIIPLHPVLVVAVIDLLGRIEAVLGRQLGPSDTLFNFKVLGPRYTSNPDHPDALRPRIITDFFKRITKNSGLVIGAHRFRHTFATRICNPAEGEADIFTAQTILGHTSLQSTRGYVQTQLSGMLKMIKTLEFPEREKRADAYNLTN